jgi:hypothetical protein
MATNRMRMTRQQAIAAEVARLTPLVDAIKDLPNGRRTREAVVCVAELIASGQITVADVRWLA